LWQGKFFFAVENAFKLGIIVWLVEVEDRSFDEKYNCSVDISATGNTNVKENFKLGFLYTK